MNEIAKKLVFLVLMVSFAYTGLITMVEEAAASDVKPVLAVVTPLIKMSDCKAIIVMGSGYLPGQEIHLLFTTSDGQQSDIGYAIKPNPIPDKTGSWATTWNASHFVKKKLVSGGAYKLSVVDSDYRPIAHVPVYFQPETEKKEDKKK